MAQGFHVSTDQSSPINLTPTVVEELYAECLFRDGEATDGAVISEGIMSTAGFHPGRIKASSGKIRSLLARLPDDFRESEGGGMSFLNACHDRDGDLWTRDQRIMDLLFQLGVAVGAAKCLMTRDLWSSLPGGMPYYSVKA